MKKGKYLIIIFRNKVRYKIINSYMTLENATECFENAVKESQKVLFEIKIKNGREVKDEIALVKKVKKKLMPLYRRDSLGRNTSVDLEDEGYSIIRIRNYKTPETIYNVLEDKRMDIKTVMENYLFGKSIKMISKLNNKIIIQEDEKLTWLTAKTVDEADRFLDALERYFREIKKTNCIIVRDVSIAQRSYLYEMYEKEGFTKTGFLYKLATTWPKKR